MALASACALVQMNHFPTPAEARAVSSQCTASSHILTARTQPFSSHGSCTLSRTSIRTDAFFGRWSVPGEAISMRNCRRALATRSEVAVDLGGSPRSEHKAAVGSRIKVSVPIKVYHIPKVPEFNLEGLEGEVKEILGEWKGKPVSANLPLKVQFQAEIDGKTTNFVAHVKDDEFEVL